MTVTESDRSSARIRVSDDTTPHTLSFPAKVGGAQIVTCAAGTGGKLNVTTVGGDADLERTATKGLFYMDGKGAVGVVLSNSGSEWALPTTGSEYAYNWTSIVVKSVSVKDLAGHLAKLYLLVPKLDIKSPNGDPLDSANATNELIFDKTSTGTCVFHAIASDLAELSTAGKTLVHNKCKWTIGSVGTVAPQFSPATQLGGDVTITYASMPAKYNDFGRKELTLKIDGVDKWQWYNHVEFFFHARGTGATNTAGQENWFYYWSQIKSPTAGAGNSAGVTFSQSSTINYWDFLGPQKKSEIALIWPDSLHGYIGILAHEQKHETDFF